MHANTTRVGCRVALLEGGNPLVIYFLNLLSQQTLNSRLCSVDFETLPASSLLPLGRRQHQQIKRLPTYKAYAVHIYRLETYKQKLPDSVVYITT